MFGIKINFLKQEQRANEQSGFLDDKYKKIILALDSTESSVTSTKIVILIFFMLSFFISFFFFFFF